MLFYLEADAWSLKQLNTARTTSMRPVRGVGRDGGASRVSWVSQPQSPMHHVRTRVGSALFSAKGTMSHLVSVGTMQIAVVQAHVVSLLF